MEERYDFMAYLPRPLPPAAKKIPKFEQMSSFCPILRLWIFTDNGAKSLYIVYWLPYGKKYWREEILLETKFGGIGNLIWRMANMKLVKEIFVKNCAELVPHELIPLKSNPKKVITPGKIHKMSWPWV